MAQGESTPTAEHRASPRPPQHLPKLCADPSLPGGWGQYVHPRVGLAVLLQVRIT